MTGSVVQGEKPKGNIAETAVDETNECVSEPKIPERRKTPIMHRLESKIRDPALPVPDPDCSPAVTRLRKTSFKDKTRTPEILKLARQRKIDKHQQDRERAEVQAKADAEQQ